MKKITSLLFIFFLSLLIIVIVFNHFEQHFSSQLITNGDLALDMVMTNQIRDDGYLLTGHYSRFGFHHPGPFFFYVNYFFEELFSSSELSRYSIWAISTISLNLIFFFLTAFFITKIFNKGSLLIAIIALLPAFVLFLDNDLRNLMWMPFRLVLPFTAFLASVVLISQRKFEYIPISMLLGCILIHGYVLMPLFIFLTLIFALLVALFLTKKNITKAEVKYFYYAITIGALFVSPLVIDFFINNPGNVKKILLFTQSLSTHENASIKEVLIFTLSYWSHFKYLILASLSSLILTLFVTKKFSIIYSNLLNVLLIILFVTVVFIVYYTTAPKPLYDFMGMYYSGAPFLLCSLVLYLSLSYIKHSKLQITSLIFICVFFISYFQINKTPKPNLDIDVITISQSLIDREGVNNLISINYEPHTLELFALSSGILRYLADSGFKVCISRPELAIMFTEKGTCKADISNKYIITSNQPCEKNNKCIIRSGKYNLKTSTYVMDGKKLALRGCELPVIDAVKIEDKCFATKHQKGFVTFGPYIRLQEGQYEFEFSYSSKAPTSEIIGKWDISSDKGHTIYSTGPIRGTNGLDSYINGNLPFIDKKLSEKVFEIRSILLKNKELVIHRLTIKKQNK